MGAESTVAISELLARFAARLTFDDVPPRVRERAKHLMLDAVGVALAASREEFARVTLEALSSLEEPGGHVLLGLDARLPLRDAVVLNGELVHGLDFDDTYTHGAMHATASAFPCALGMAEKLRRSGKDLLTAYVTGMEVATRLGSVSPFGFHRAGFHASGVIGAFACALIAGKLLEADEERLVMAQGIALSTASGSIQYSENGAWTKGMHPGWAGAGGITAAYLAQSGFLAPRLAYEGRFGLFPSHLGAQVEGCDYGRATAGLGEQWEIERVAVKPFPVCHFAHACADAAIALSRDADFRPGEIERVEVRVPPQVVPVICEPEEVKRRPRSVLDAQFSVPYITAASLLRGRFGLRELDRTAWTDPEILALAGRITCQDDPSLPFPEYFSGEVAVTLRDGKRLVHREEKNRGAGNRPLTREDIVAKFLANATLAVSAHRAETIRDLVLGLDDLADARVLADGLSGAGMPTHRP